MKSPVIALIANSQAALQTPLVDAVLARWPQDRRPTLIHASLHEAAQDEKALSGAQMAWILADAATPASLNSLLGLIHERSLPTLVTRAGEVKPFGPSQQDGVMIVPPDADPVEVHGALLAMITQVPVFRSLQSEVKLLQIQHGGLCDQMDKIDEELRLAAQLQREFLPKKMPGLGGIEFRAMWRPAGYVSGDIYDVVRLDETHVGFFIADAVGHGVPAALMTMFIKRCLHMKVIDPKSSRGYRIVPPNVAMAMLNRDMCHQQTGKMRFATAWYGVINCETRELQYCRAGHPFPLLLHTDGSCEELDADGAMLGIFLEEDFELQTRQLDQGDRLLVFSDGFEFAFPKPDATDAAQPTTPPATIDGGPLPGNEYTEELKMLADGTLDEALERLAQKVDLAAGSLNQKDDLTVICMAVTSRLGEVPIEALMEDELTEAFSG